MKTKKLTFLLALLIMIVFTLPACVNTAEKGEEAEEEKMSEDMQGEEATNKNTYTLTPFEPSAEFPDATMESMDFQDGVFTFEISGDSYELGVQTPDAPQKMCANSAKGQHIHLIVDDQPYAAKYTSTFDYEIDNGAHYVLAFLSRSYHESIKTPQAHKAVMVNVANNSFMSVDPIPNPLLFYSRPKGTYVGKDNTEKVMLDFYLVNVELGDKYKVEVEINGEQTFTVDEWQPYYIEGLPMGDNKIKLTLVDANGEAVNAPLNPVERVFTLKEDPAEME